jgi:prepilin-type N-terminal cleavage/methylation domain-containing protein
MPILDRSGFSLVELMVAIVVFAVGMIGFAGTTTVLARQSNLAELRTERMTAVVSTIERLRSLPYDSVGSGFDSIPPFAVSWTTTPTGNAAKLVRIVTVGPGAKPTATSPMPIVSGQVADTFTYRLLEP